MSRNELCLPNVNLVPLSKITKYGEYEDNSMKEK